MSAETDLLEAPVVSKDSVPTAPTRAGWADAAVTEAVRRLSVVDDKRFLLDLLLQWAVIAGAAAIAIWSGQWWMYGLAMLVIATRQHALGVIMHDGTHYRLLRNRAANDAISDLFCALPVGMLTSRYKHEHMLHHRYLNTDRDPYWVDFKNDDMWHWPKSPMSAISVFVRDLLMINGPRWGAVMFRWSPWINHFRSDPEKDGPPVLTPAERARVYGFHLVVVALFVVPPFGWKLALLWLLPLLTVVPVMIRLRTICEHLVLPNRSELDASRHTDASWWERLTIAPKNINLHLDHHLFPSVPYYNLPELHETLLGNQRYTGTAILNKRYLSFEPGGLLREIISRPAQN